MSVLDRSAGVREGEELDAAAVGEYLRGHIPGLRGTPVIQQFRGGASNLTYEVAFADRSFVLRRPPFGTKAKSAHDMRREFTIQKALKPHFLYVPEMIAYCDDPSVIGSDFYVMEKLTGIIPRANLPRELTLSEPEVRELCRNVLDTLIELHRIDPAVAGDVGKGAGYVRRQIEGWSDRYRRARTENVGDCETVMQWLAANIRDEVRLCVVHNDFRFDNVVLDPQQPTRVIGVLDWEMATIGDPLMDLGNSLAYWIEPADPEFLQMTRRQPTTLPGMMTRDEIVQTYCERMGLGEVQFAFYRIYGLFRLAVIAQQIYYRYHHGQTKNPDFASYHALVNFLEQYCLELIEEEG
jgi:aminoglycoside phosphotransferase (APT) family kinase protein